MKNRCIYCGSQIKDNETVCPFCGKKIKMSKDSSKKQISEEKLKEIKGTPRTIEELKAWYKSKNLPPYEITRFFIGQNHVGPRAFGVYQDGDNFITYKNKANGSRAIRYEGPSEAKAVKELYLKLKEEIANQKKNNQMKREKRIAIGAVVFSFVIVLFICGIALFSESKDNDKRARQPHNNYYWYQDSMYYCEGHAIYYDWWLYDHSIQDYYLYQTIEYDYDKELEEYFPDGMTNENSIHSYYVIDIYDELYPTGRYCNRFDNKYYIFNSHNYIDAGHHYAPYGNGYYTVDDNIYYYLDDIYSRYSDYDSGWYIYDNGGWVYYSDPYVYETLGDSLWYSADDYYVGETIDDYYAGFYDNYYEQKEWAVNTDVNDFESTDYYAGYENAYEAREIELEAEREAREESSFWDNWDSDSNWDSSDSWDSSSTDWGSDW